MSANLANMSESKQVYKHCQTCFRKVDYEVEVVILESCSGNLKAGDPKLVGS